MKEKILENIYLAYLSAGSIKNTILNGRYDKEDLLNGEIVSNCRNIDHLLKTVKKYIEQEKEPVKFSDEEKMLLMTCVFDHIVEQVESDQFEFWFNMVKKVCEL